MFLLFTENWRGLGDWPLQAEGIEKLHHWWKFPQRCYESETCKKFYCLSFILYHCSPTLSAPCSFGDPKADLETLTFASCQQDIKYTDCFPCRRVRSSLQAFTYLWTKKMLVDWNVFKKKKNKTCQPNPGSFISILADINKDGLNCFHSFTRSFVSLFLLLSLQTLDILPVFAFK